MLVDKVFRTEEIVVKPLSSVLRHVTMFSGNTILGDGSVIMIIDPNAVGAMVGPVDAKAELAHAATVDKAEANEARTALLLFRAGSQTLKAVPLSLITRLEEISVEAIERCNGGRRRAVSRGADAARLYADRARAAPETACSRCWSSPRRGHPAGLAIDEIVDIVEEPLTIDLQADTPGVIGAAIVRDQAVEMIDVSHYLGEIFDRHRARGPEETARGAQAAARRRQPILPRHAGAASDGRRL